MQPKMWILLRSPDLLTEQNIVKKKKGRLGEKRVKADLLLKIFSVREASEIKTNLGGGGTT